MLIIRRSKLHYTASGIITLKQVSWPKITKIQFYKYEQIVVTLMCEFFGCDYCVLLTINLGNVNRHRIFNNSNTGTNITL